MVEQYNLAFHERQAGHYAALWLEQMALSMTINNCSEAVVLQAKALCDCFFPPDCHLRQLSFQTGIVSNNHLKQNNQKWLFDSNTLSLRTLDSVVTTALQWHRYPVPLPIASG